MNASPKTALVVSAHSADFVWRAGGSIALHAQQGYAVHIVCLSYGERGESARLWRKGEMSEQRVKQARREEAQQAADIVEKLEFQYKAPKDSWVFSPNYYKP